MRWNEIEFAMRKQWFGDTRDYVKWSFVYSEASPNASVCYIAMARPDEIKGTVHPTVIRFFDKSKDLGLVREMFSEHFLALLDGYGKAQRHEYFDQAESLIKEGQSMDRVVIFIDPDTGIEPPSGGDSRHICLADLRRLCDLLRSGDKLIVYQHAPIMRKKTWIEDGLGRILDGEWTRSYRVTSYHNTDCASEVCFLKFERSKTS
jgi:hypothetical protein